MNIGESKENNRDIDSAESEKDPKSGRGHFRLLKRILIFTIIGFWAFMIVLTILVTVYFNPYLKDQLIYTVSTNTDSLYQLQIEKLNIDFLRSSVEIKGLSLKKDPNKWEKVLSSGKDQSHIGLDLAVEDIKITKIRWLRFWREGDLEIGKILLKSPKIEMLNHQAQDSNRVQRSFDEQLSTFVESFAEFLHIEELEIRDSDISFRLSLGEHKSFHEGDSIFLKMRNIRVEGARKVPDQVADLMVQDLAVEGQDYRFTTPNGLYEFSSGNFLMSSVDSVIRIEDLMVKPLFEQSPQDLLNNDKNTQVRVNARSIQALGLDFFRAVYQQEFDLRALQTEGLVLEINKLALPQKTTAEAQSQDDPGLIGTEGLKSSLKDLPVYFRCDTVSLLDAYIDYREQNANNPGQLITYHQLDSLYLTFEYLALGKALDKISIQLPLYSRNVNLIFSDYDYQTPDGVYELSIGPTRISSFDSLAQLKGIRLRPLMNKRQFSVISPYQEILLDAEVDQIELGELDIEKLAYEQEFILGRISVIRPQVKAYLDKTKEKRPGQRYQNFEELLQSIPLYIDVDTLDIQEAGVVYEALSPLAQDSVGEEKHQLNNINLRAFQIQLGQALNRPALAEVDTKSLLLQLSNYAFIPANKRYEISIAGLDVSSGKSYIRLDTVRMKPLVDEETFSSRIQYQSSLLDIQVDNIVGEDIDFKKLLMFQEVDWGGLRLVNPVVSVYQDKRKPRRKVKDTLKFELDTLSQDSLASRLSSQIQIDLPEEDSIKAHFDFIYHFFPNSSRDSLFFINNPGPYPIQPDDRYYNTFNRNLTDTSGLRSFLMDIPLYLKIDTLRVQNGTFIFRSQENVAEGSGLSFHFADAINFAIPKIRLGKATQDSSFMHFYSGNIFFSLKDYEFKDKNDKYKFRLNGIESSLEDSLLLINELRFRPLLSQKSFIRKSPYRNTYIDTQLSSIQADAIDIDRLVFDQEFVLNSLFVQKPHVYLFTDGRKKPRPRAQVRKSLDDLLRSVPFYIKMDTFGLQDASLDYKVRHTSRNGLPTLARHYIPKINLSAQNLELGIDRALVKNDNSDQAFNTDKLMLQVEDYLYLSPDSLYQLSFDQLQSKLTDSILSIEKISYKPLFQPEQMDSILNRAYLRPDIELDAIEVHLADLNSFMKNEVFHFHKIQMDRPVVNLYRNQKLPPVPNALPPFPNLNSIIKVDTLALRGGELKFARNFIREGKEEWNRHRADSINLSFYDIYIDSTAIKSNDRLLFSEDIEVDLRNYHTRSRDSLYMIDVKHLKASSRKGAVLMDKVSILPSEDIDSIFVVKKGGYQIDRFRTIINRIALEKVDFQKIINDQDVHIGQLEIDSLDLNIYRDKTFEKDSSQVPVMPHLAFQSISFPFLLDTLKILHADITYGEKVPLGKGVGKVNFDNVNVGIHGLNNQGDETDTTFIEARGKLMSEGDLSARIKIPLMSPVLYCQYEGELGQMEAEFFNSIIESNEHIRIKKGHINKVKYNVELSDTLAQGSLGAGYRKLKIQVLKEEDHNRKKSFITFLANLIINNRNNLERRRSKTGEVAYTLKKEDGFIKVLWKSLSTGLVDTLK